MDSLKLSEREMKFKFISICAKSELAMAVEILLDEEFQLFLKAKTIVIKRELEAKEQKKGKRGGVEVIPLKRLVKWQFDK
jgi:uncharacterized GH25 family protein